MAHAQKVRGGGSRYDRMVEDLYKDPLYAKVAHEMKRFISWFNNSEPLGKSGIRKAPVTPTTHISNSRAHIPFCSRPWEDRQGVRRKSVGYAFAVHRRKACYLSEDRSGTYDGFPDHHLFHRLPI